ncbi:MAG: hypothetical protein JW876_11710 [Candidatus Krumholzibacteriota bacterium]|nr:hypothetical protein [Candidatus Krumholzibacteriota bacterium]
MKKWSLCTPNGDVNLLRVLWHVLGGLAIVAGLLVWRHDRRLPVLILAAASLLLFILDVFRFRTRYGRYLFWRHLRHLASSKEREGMNTSFYYVASLTLCVLVFPPGIAIGCVVCLAVGDQVAGIVGRFAGRVRWGEKSVEGALASFAVCLVLIRLFVPSTRIALAGAAAGALAELAPTPGLDDNIKIPLVAGGVMYGVMLFG